MRRRTRRDGAALTVTALLLGVIVPPALAEPPSAEEVAEAEAGIVRTTASIASLEVRLARVRAEAVAVEVAAAEAAERYNAAVVALEEAESAAVETQARAAEAQERLAAATDALGRVAMAAHRAGGGLAPLEAFLTADGLEDVAARDRLVDRLGQRAVAALQAVEATRVVADVLERRAREAVEARADAAAEVAASARAAQAAAAAARTRVVAAEAERTGLLARLAAFRRTTVEAELARQEALDAERRRRQEAAARAAALRTRVAASPTTAPAPAASQVPPAPSSPAPSSPAPARASARPGAPAPAPAAVASGSRSSAATQQAALQWALTQVGKPYVWGAAGPHGYDCSGLTMRAYQSVGISLSRTTEAQYAETTHVPIGQMRPGDLIFYSSNGAASGIYHLAIYAGSGMRVHAPSPGKLVEHVPMYWTNVLPYVGRP